VQLCRTQEKENITGSARSLVPAVLPVPSLNQADYGDVKFWNKKDYMTAKKNKKISTGFQSDKSDNIMTWYVEDDSGNPVDGDTVDSMRSYARLIWQYFLDSGMAPLTWADINVVAHNYYEHHMTRRFPELGYGTNNWKAHMLATDNYSSWYGKHTGRNAKVKSEPSGGDANTAWTKGLNTKSTLKRP
jgi:hypothetical protein